MPQHLIRKLEHYVRLSPEEKDALVRLASEQPRDFSRGEDVVCEGDTPRRIYLVLSGYACRYRILADGRRQVVGVFVPGDLCDERMFVLKSLDFSIAALAAGARLAEIEIGDLVHLGDQFPRLSRAFWWDSVVGETIAREWIVNIGARPAKERLAHFLCEFYVRLSAVGLVRGKECDLPMTQPQLADTVGMSVVHTSRTIKGLQSQGLIRIQRGKLIVDNIDALMRAGRFNPKYLHMQHEGRAFDCK